MYLTSLTIQSRLSNYNVNYIEIKNILETLDPEKDVYIIDAKVYSLYYEILFKYNNSDRVYLIDAFEDNKTISCAIELIEKIIEKGISKATRIVSFGGGIIQDLSGFIASILYRGLPWLYFPTTLLSQTDSCIGAKTSINHSRYKNLLGTFYNPIDIFISPSFVETLGFDDYLSGVGELVKLSLIGGEEITKNLMNKISDLLSLDRDTINSLVYAALCVKKTYIEKDEFDKGVRNILNYGHCIGHAIESTTNYSIPHGQAVSIGMILANRLSVKKNELNYDFSNELECNVLMPIISDRHRKTNLLANGIIEAMRLDKKRVGNSLVVVYMKNNWEMYKNTNVSEEEIVSIIDRWNVEQGE